MATTWSLPVADVVSVKPPPTHASCLSFSGSTNKNNHALCASLVSLYPLSAFVYCGLAYPSPLLQRLTVHNARRWSLPFCSSFPISIFFLRSRLRSRSLCCCGRPARNYWLSPTTPASIHFKSLLPWPHRVCTCSGRSERNCKQRWLRQRKTVNCQNSLQTNCKLQATLCVFINKNHKNSQRRCKHHQYITGRCVHTPAGRKTATDHNRIDCKLSNRFGATP